MFAVLLKNLWPRVICSASVYNDAVTYEYYNITTRFFSDVYNYSHYTYHR